MITVICIKHNYQTTGPYRAGFRHVVPKSVYFYTYISKERVVDGCKPKATIKIIRIT